jgi:hypothetical protein
MTHGRRARTRHKGRHRELLGALLVLALAAVIGVVAGALAEPQPWENPPPTNTTIANSQPQGSP